MCGHALVESGHALLQRLGTVTTTVLCLVRNSTVIQHECMTPSCRFQYTVGFVGTPIIPSSSAFAAAFTSGTHAWCSAPKPCRMSFPTPPSRHNGRGAKNLIGNQEDPACANENIFFNFGNPPQSKENVGNASFQSMSFLPAHGDMLRHLRPGAVS